MMIEIEPDHWIGPTMAPMASFLEPLQGGTLKKLAAITPWAPSRSYGLVVRLDEEWRPAASYHSRADGSHHDVTSALEWEGESTRRTAEPAPCLRSTPIFGSDTMGALIELAKVTKEYREVPAIKDVDFKLRQGEIRALVRENGAGKSTLTKIIAEVTTPTYGAMRFDGREALFRSPAEASAAGVNLVFQENSLVPSMSVAQNVFLGVGKFFNRIRGVYIAAQQLMGELNFPVDP